MAIKFGKFPPAPYKRFGAMGLGIIISNDAGLKGIDIVFLFWHLTIGKIGKKPEPCCPKKSIDKFYEEWELTPRDIETWRQLHPVFKTRKINSK